MSFLFLFFFLPAPFTFVVVAVDLLASPLSLSFLFVSFFFKLAFSRLECTLIQSTGSRSGALLESSL